MQSEECELILRHEFVVLIKFYITIKYISESNIKPNNIIKGKETSSFTFFLNSSDIMIIIVIEYMD